MAELNSSKPIVLYTAATPNGYQPSILLEELKLAYPDAGIDYDFRKLNISDPVNEQKEPWYLKINPNGRIPAIVHNRPDGTKFEVFETAAILLYLAQLYDKDHKLSFPKGSDDESVALQWIFFAHGGVGPMQGQASHFLYAAKEKIPYAVKRYINETKRLYTVLNDRLTDRDYLAGPDRGRFSVADIKAYPWVRNWSFAAIKTLDVPEFRNVKVWLDRIYERPGVQAGLQIPVPPRIITEEDRKKREELADYWESQ